MTDLSRGLYLYQPDHYEVLDGDTTKVVMDLGFYLSLGTVPKEKTWWSCRISGIDTPEKRGSQKIAGLPVKDVTIKLLDSLPRLFVKSYKMGKYGKRFIGDIWWDVADEATEIYSLSEFMLHHKLALPYGGKTKHVFTDEDLERIIQTCADLMESSPETWIRKD